MIATSSEQADYLCMEFVQILANNGLLLGKNAVEIRNLRLHFSGIYGNLYRVGANCRFVEITGNSLCVTD